MSTVITGTLDRPGAQLYYEVRGQGPALLLMPGASGDTGPYAPMAAALADRYLVISYDRRGFSRSTLAGPVDNAARMTSDVQDAQALLAHLTTAPAFVLGSCSGAIVALELLIRDAGQIRLLVCHEPPLASVLAEAPWWAAFYDELYGLYRESGAKAARQIFKSRLGLGDLPRPPEGTELPVEFTDMVERIRANQPFWWEHEIRQYPAFELDAAALKAAAGRLMMAGGSSSRELHPYQCSVALAELAGSDMVELPGGHVGYMEFPAEFAEALDRVLRQA